jgi:tetratricopeptide (TPR) repeat protein
MKTRWRSKRFRENARSELAKANAQLEISAEEEDLESPEYLAALLNSGIMLSRLGETERGIAMTNRFLEAAQELIEPGHERVFDGYKLLAVFADQLRGKAEQSRATELDARVLDFAVSTFGEADIKIAKALVNLSMDHASEGDYGRAVAEMTRALEISSQNERSERLSIRHAASLKNWERRLKKDRE